MPEEGHLNMVEGFVRLDRLQVVEEKFLNLRNVAPTDDALWFISEWLRFHLTGEIDEGFLADRQARLSELF